MTEPISVVIPAFNEQRRIVRTLEEVVSYLKTRGQSYEIVIVNDGSSDDTLGVLTSFAKSSPEAVIIDQNPNMGKGWAVRRGMMAASKPVILMMDADLATPMEELPKLEQAIAEGADVAIGSRAIKGSILPVPQPFLRRIGGRALNLMIQMLAAPGIRDTQCGFKLFRRQAAREIFQRCVIDGYGNDVESIYLARKLGYKIAEVGITWYHKGESKVRPLRDALRILADVRRMRRQPYEFSLQQHVRSRE